MDPVDLRTTNLEPAAGRLLVAAPLLRDPNFVHTIVLLLDVEEDDGGGADGGVLGVVLNRPGSLPVGEVLASWHDVVGRPEVVFQGGPVGTDSALAVARLDRASASADLEGPVGWRPLFGATGLVDLDAPSELVGPALGALRIYAGYAGWSRGQLGEEIAEGAWYVVDAEPDDVFATDPDRLWAQVLRRQPGRLAWLATYPIDPTRN